ncbi:MAG: hypothetical protein ACTIJT_12510 [Mesonia sp.]|uniref:hypothetical protein n=1 Tax=Mesonia sp. TaxID=1960830 RepID=UPI003F9E769C
MILKIIGACWMIAPVLILFNSKGDTATLFPWAAFSFILGFLLFRASSKKKRKISSEKEIDYIKVGSAKKEDSVYSNEKKLRPEYNAMIDSEIDEDEEEMSEEHFVNELKYAKGSPGETARFITNLYLNKIRQEKEDPVGAKADLIKERYSIYSRLGDQISDDDIDNAIITYAAASLQELILFFKLYESLSDENTIQYFKIIGLIFNVIIDESNNLLPEDERIYLDEEEINTIAMRTFTSVISKNNK